MTDSTNDGGATAAAGQNNSDVADALREQFGEQIHSATIADGALQVEVAAQAIVAVCRHLSTEIEQPYPYLSDAFGVDYGDHLQVVYHLVRPETAEGALVRTNLPRDNATMPTLTGLYNTANWAEREIAEMFGVTFEGHPDPRKLLLPEDWQGYPLRKDYQPPDHPYLAAEPLHEDPTAFLSEETEFEEDSSRPDPEE